MKKEITKESGETCSENHKNGGRADVKIVGGFFLTKLWNAAKQLKYLKLLSFTLNILFLGNKGKNMHDDDLSVKTESW